MSSSSSYSSACTNGFDTEGIETFNVQSSTAAYDDFTDRFSNTRSIEWMHYSIPRFNNNQQKDMSVLIDGTSQEKEDYVWGLISTSIAIFCIFAFWMVLLLIFKACGPRKVGFLSGRRVPLPSKNQYVESNGGSGGADNTSLKVDDIQLEEEWDEMYSKTKRSNQCMKYLVIFAGLSIVTCAILLTIKGFDGLVLSLQTGFGTIEIVKDLLTKGIQLIDTILNNQAAKEENIEQLLVDMNTICPAIREELCTDITDIPGSCNFEGVFDGEIIKDTMIFFANLRMNIESELTKTKQDLQDMINSADQIQSQMTNFDWALYCSMAFSLGLATLILCMMVGVFFKLSTFTRFLQNCLCVPLFVLLVVLSWAFSMAFVIGALGLADFCIDSPDTLMLQILEANESNFASLLYAFIVYYISGCPLSEKPNVLAGFAEFTADSISNLNNLLVVENGFQDVFCENSGAAAAMALVARFITELLCSTGNILRELRDFLSCANWYPLYENTVYDALCYKGTDGFAWVTITQFIIVLMAMIILTFRIVFYEIEIEEDDNIDEEVNQDNDSTNNKNYNTFDINDNNSNDDNENETIQSTKNRETSEQPQQPFQASNPK